MTTTTRAWEGQRRTSAGGARATPGNSAKENGAQPGTYMVETIAIEAENPIRGYIVVISPGG